MATIDKEKDNLFTTAKQEIIDIKSSEALALLIEILYGFSDEDDLYFIDNDFEEIKA